MTIRPATLSDLDAIMRIVTEAREFMRLSGLDQWQSDYPTREMFADDVARGECYVLSDGGKAHGVFCPVSGIEPSYAGLEGGVWLTDGPYITIHRVALDDALRGAGASRSIFDFCEALARERGMASLRIDTHRDNRPMNAAVKKYGYTLCGSVVYPGGRERVTYEKPLL